MKDMLRCSRCPYRLFAETQEEHEAWHLTQDHCISDWCETVLTHQHLKDNQWIQAGYCHTCAFWQQQAAADEDTDRAFINPETWNHYRAGISTGHGGTTNMRGSYGRQYTIELFDQEGEPLGRTLETDDLWHQGEIPTQWLPLFANVPRGTPKEKR